MQKIGTDVCRETFGKDVWCNLLAEDLKTDQYVVEDIRFKSEYEYFKRNGSKSIRIISDKSICSTHSSENDLDDIETDYVIYNDKDIEHLEKEIGKIIIDLML